jgi:glucosamine-6-phosphate deaminase
MKLNLLSTIEGSLLEGFFPAGWDLAKIDACCDHPPQEIALRQGFWHDDFEPVPCGSLNDFETMMGHEVALEILRAKQADQDLILILPVGPMGMYRWIVYFLSTWGVDCQHVHGFNMDEWSDAEGDTLPAKAPGAFEGAMTEAFYGPLGALTVPVSQRHFATRDSLPQYGAQIAALRADGARLVTVYGIGRVFHIAFWEPHFAAEFASVAAWKEPTHRLGAKLHPLTIEQNAITSFKSRTTAIPAFANTIGPGLFLESDRCIGGCDGALGRGMMWQGMSLWVTLRYGPDMWVPSSWMPTLPGRLFFLEELAGPLIAEAN